MSIITNYDDINKYLQEKDQKKDHSWNPISKNGLTNSKAYQEYEQFITDTVIHSYTVEEKQKAFLKDLSVFNSRTGESYNMFYDFQSAKKEEAQLALQRSMTIEYIASQEKDIAKAMITITNPSRFHRFKKLRNGKYIENPQYDKSFKSLLDSYQQGYKNLQDFDEYLKKQLRKSLTAKGHFFMHQKVIEPSKQNSPHLHLLIYFPAHKKNTIMRILMNAIELKKMNRKGTDVQWDIQNGSLYLTKYIRKALSDDEDNFFNRFIDGWKRRNKIRLYTTSNIPAMPLYVFKRLYHSLNRKTIEYYIKKAKENHSTLLYEFSQVTEINITTKTIRLVKNYWDFENVQSTKTIKRKPNKKTQFRVKLNRIVHKYKDTNENLIITENEKMIAVCKKVKKNDIRVHFDHQGKMFIDDRSIVKYKAEKVIETLYDWEYEDVNKRKIMVTDLKIDTKRERIFNMSERELRRHLS